MHAGSEHTIDGERFDLEMHTVHFPSGDAGNGFIASAMGLIFSVDNYDRSVTDDQISIIDNFFDSMRWDEANPVVSMVSYGTLMEMANFNKRWVYKGSVTTPPCATNVYWNVLSTIYPIKQKYVDLFKQRLDSGTPGLSALGNYRLAQPINGQDVIYVTEDPRENDGGDWEGDKWEGDSWEDNWDPCACLGFDALPTDFLEDQGYGAWYGSSCKNWDAEEDYC